MLCPSGPVRRFAATEKAVVMSTVLLTGFEPFDGEIINPSWEMVKQLHAQHFSGAEIIACQLPCVFGRSIDVLNAAIDRYQPAVVLAVGQAGGRQRLSVERVAINVIDARIADNNGQQPIDQRIVADGPAAYFATLPIKGMVRAMLDQGIPAEVSQTAGTFVCNQVMYGLLHRLAHEHYPVRGGFIHVPYLPQQAAAIANVASMSEQTMLAGLRIAIQTALEIKQDIRFGGGAIS